VPERNETDLETKVDAIRDEYARRAIAPQCVGEYSFLNPVHAALVLDRERAILAALTAHLELSLGDAEILDVGSGVGTSLALLAAYGASAARLHGIDILEHRVQIARDQFPALDVRVGDGHTLPYPDASFDLVQQITMLSSVHDRGLREQLVAEMARVLRPGGLLLSYDAAPVGLAPRLLSRGLRLLDRPHRDRVAAQPAAGEVVLTPVHALSAGEIAALFGQITPLVVKRMTPYRPLAARVFRSQALFAVSLRKKSLSSTVLFLGRKP
jgi:ubiquinone/menaquinone biosynthesis C-methylase UbiE